MVENKKKGSITAEEKVEIFKAELDRIFDRKIREFTKLCIVSAPDYFFLDCPASSSGKFHNINELGHDGTIIHSKRVMTLAYELCRAFGCEGSTDLVISASLLHDLRKQGYTKTGHTQRKHPQYAAELVDEVQSATMLLTNEEHQIIRNCVGFHYGLWSSEPWIKSLDKYTKEEMVVYTADYVASKRCVNVDYKR